MIHIDGSEKFLFLSAVTCMILVLPHSNADKEHTFRMIRKNTSFRASYFQRS